MTHFETDVRFPAHRKVRQLGKDRAAGAGVWLLAGCWSRLNNNTGFVPVDVVAKECGDPRRRLAARLVEVGLWIEDEEKGEQGYRFKDWSDWRSADALEADAEEAGRRRASDAERKRRQRERVRDDELVSANGHVTSHGDGHVTGHVTPPPFSPPHPPSSHPSLPFGERARAAATRAPARDAHPRGTHPPTAEAETAVRTFLPRGISSRTRFDLGLLVDRAASDGASWAAIEHALIAWRSRTDAGVGLFPNLVDDAVRAEHGATNGRQAAPRTSTADAAVAAAEALRDAPGGDPFPTLRALTGGQS